MPARPHNAISGILAGGILGFGIVTFFLWHLSAHPVLFLVSCCFQRMACSVLGTQAALSQHFSLRRIMILHSTDSFFVVGFCFLFVCCSFFFVVACVFCSVAVCGFCLVLCFSSVERHHTTLARRAQEAYYINCNCCAVTVCSITLVRPSTLTCSLLRQLFAAWRVLLERSIFARLLFLTF